MLVAVHTLVAGHRLFDVLDLIEDDPRVQIMFTVAPDAFNHPVHRHLSDLGALVLPWEQATKLTFDLVIAAAHGGLSELHGPILMMAHGAGRGKYSAEPERGGPVLARKTVYGLDSARLARDGRVLASKILLAHDAESDILLHQCPEAMGVAVVVGDPCYDRLVSSLPHRDRYRRGFGVTSGDRLILVSSTWGADGLFGNTVDLLPRLMEQLAGTHFRVGVVLHPAVWSAHGVRQVRAWLRDCTEAGLRLVDPTHDWRAAVIAADHVVGDHGSVTAYAAAIGRPVLSLAGVGVDRLRPGSAQSIVLRQADRLDLSGRIAEQFGVARPLDRDTVVQAITSRPGQAGTLIRRALYELLRLDEPGRHRGPAPVPDPPSTSTLVVVAS
ncbi:hypothetical protein [Virgisporangium aurantiacum]|uniref:Uncharacterized protein n=1 Tax=Virgisporangium aurantiacum TaxID=175570 RepID=A0A8J4DW94_9ACTN|nr:hypothetical protein [Virgisporangium aurantiacum]GIJ52629.1 hypothetical protein Vau01_001450 [Virgisporangium aurantiacum]